MNTNHTIITENFPLFVMLDTIRAALEEAPWGTYSGHQEDNVANLMVTYHTDEEGDYALIGFGLPDCFFAEIDGGTYGSLFGLRVYRDDVQ